MPSTSSIFPASGPSPGDLCAIPRFARMPTSYYQPRHSRNPRPSSLSMSSWLGNLDIVGSPLQIDFLRKSHVSNHLGTTYPTNNRIADFRCGEILMIPWYAPNLDERNAIGSPTVAYAASTGAICAKKRPVVSNRAKSHLVRLLTEFRLYSSSQGRRW